MRNSGILLAAHGSKLLKAKEQVEVLRNELTKALPDSYIISGFLEYAKPRYRDAVLELIRQGVKRITVLPLFLFEGQHISIDLPTIFSQLHEDFPDVHFDFAERLGTGDEIFQLLMHELQRHHKANFADRIILVSSGSSNKDSNQELIRLASRMRGHFKEIDFLPAFMASTVHPNFEQVFQSASFSNNKVAVMPILLFSGFYLTKIQKLIFESTQCGNSKPELYSLISEMPGFINILKKRIEAVKQNIDSSVN